MIILHVAPVTWRGIGGIHVSVPALVSSQNRLDGVEAALVVTASNAGKPPEVEHPVFDRKVFFKGRHVVWGRKVVQEAADRLNLPAPFDRPDLVVFHSTYIPVHAAIAARLRKASIPYVICPRGGMTRYAQRYHGWKKGLANLLFFNKMVSRAAALHCLTQGEAEASYGWNRPMFVVGNGTYVPAAADVATPGRSTQLRLVFIGRLHLQYKGLDMLPQACNLVRSELGQAGAVVELHGPDCGRSSKVLARQIARLRLEDLVTLHGPVVDEAKGRLLSRSDVFLHPSRSEGHPIAVLEALAYGLPCLLTPVTHMADEVAAVAAGWEVEPSPAGIAAGLRQILMTDRTRLQQAGARARRLAVEKYSWGEIAVRSVRAYQKCAA